MPAIKKLLDSLVSLQKVKIRIKAHVDLVLVHLNVFGTYDNRVVGKTTNFNLAVHYVDVCIFW